MKLFGRIFSFVIIALMTTACSDDDTGASASYEYPYSSCFNYVYNKMSGTGATYTGVSYDIKFDLPTYDASIKVKNVKFAERMPAIDFELTGLKWSNKNGAMVIDATDVIPVVNGQAMPEYTIDKLSVAVYDRYVVIDGQAKASPVFVIQYTINDTFEVTVVPQEVLYASSTGVVNVTDNSIYNNGGALYWVRFDAQSMTADIEIDGAKFAEGMPALNDMKFEDIPVTFYTGGYTLAADALTPSIANVPYPNYAITALSGNGLFASGLDLRFRCMEIYAVSATLSILVNDYGE